MDYTLYSGDCLTEMNKIPDGSIDAIIGDLPYGITSNVNDEVIPYELMWKHFSRILKDGGVFVTTASQPFSSLLVCSKLDWFKHEWIWQKNRGSNFANTVREPMKEHEHVLVFSRGQWTYNPQMENRKGSGKDRVKYAVEFKTNSGNYREFEPIPHQMLSELRVPSSVQKFNTNVGSHPQQKPLDLFIYLVMTYTNPGETVLDCTMGSGTTGVACGRTGRKFIGIEMLPDPTKPVSQDNPDYFGIAENRIMNAYGDYVPTPKEAVSPQLSIFDKGSEIAP